MATNGRLHLMVDRGIGNEPVVGKTTWILATMRSDMAVLLDRYCAHSHTYSGRAHLMLDRGVDYKAVARQTTSIHATMSLDMIHATMDLDMIVIVDHYCAHSHTYSGRLHLVLDRDVRPEAVAEQTTSMLDRGFGYEAEAEQATSIHATKSLDVTDILDGWDRYCALAHEYSSTAPPL